MKGDQNLGEMEDDLNFMVNGRRPHFRGNGRRPQFRVDGRQS